MEPPCMSWFTYHQMLLDTRNKNTYGLRVGISTVFEIFGHFLFRRGRDYLVMSWPTCIYHQIFLDTKNKNMYGYGVGISTVFEIFGHFLFKGGPPLMVMPCIPSDDPWHKEQECIQFRHGEFSSFQDIKKSPYCAPTPPPEEMQTL
jgi:CRISPR/Cas system CMR-associated protein Cmr3 (group 5 of RAMP superfamily)